MLLRAGQFDIKEAFGSDNGLTPNKQRAVTSEWTMAWFTDVLYMHHSDSLLLYVCTMF